MKNFTIDDELEKTLNTIGQTFGHKDIYETVFNGFLFLRFLENIKKEENKLFLQYKDGKTIELPVSELLKKNIKEEEEPLKPETTPKEKPKNKKKTEKKSKIIR